MKSNKKLKHEYIGILGCGIIGSAIAKGLCIHSIKSKTTKFLHITVS